VGIVGDTMTKEEEAEYQRLVLRQRQIGVSLQQIANREMLSSFQRPNASNDPDLMNRHEALTEEHARIDARMLQLTGGTSAQTEQCEQAPLSGKQDDTIEK
jgi:DNA-binding transcriptional MerR regulator